ncbi:MAG: RND transporter [Hyphomonadaceae bacterium]|nr:RND transporter [Hyphomonadaceae bacterium]OUX95611.1 MAG: hypothetical protein CBB77_00300 [Hyphomonas sp. TMED17]
MVRFVCGFAPLLMAGCMSLQTSGEPAADLLQINAEPPANWTRATAAPVEPDIHWLASFNVPELSGLVSEALTQNSGLKAQYLTVMASRQQLAAVRGRGLPNATLGLSSTGSSAVAGLPGFEERRETNAFGVNANIGWEPDLWGRIGAGIDASVNELLASEADYAAARLSLAAQTVTAWFDLNEALAQERVARKTLSARDRARELTERRFDRGLASALDVRTTRSSVASAEAAIAQRMAASGNAARRLEVLLGRYPATEIDASANVPALQPLSDAGTPASLLVHRPDIVAAEARVVAAGFRAEQARLALFPVFNLNASLATNEDRLSSVFDPSRLAAQAVASLAGPLYSGGSLRAEREAALIRAEAALERYAATVLNAWKEVEDARAADRALLAQEEALLRSLEQALLAEDLAERQYSRGLVSIFNLIEAQTRRLNAESSLVAVRSGRASNRVFYHLALGSGLAPTIATNK